MKLALSLREKVLLIAGLNLLLLFVASSVFLQIQRKSSFGDFLATIGGGRVLSLAQGFSDEARGLPPEQVDQLLAEYAERYGLGFHLFVNDGRQAAGQPVTLPEQLRERLRQPNPRRILERRPPPGERGRAEAGSGPLEEGRRPPRLRPDGTPMPADGALRRRQPGIPDVPPFLEVTDGSPRYWIGVRMAVHTGAGRPSPGTLLLTSDSLLANRFLVPWRSWLALFSLALCTAFLCWMPFVQGVTTALRRMTKTTKEIAEGKLDARVDAGRGDELGALGDSINRMGLQLEKLVKGQKQFLRDAAHEIRSPLGRMQLAVSILERDLVDPKQQSRLKDLRDDMEEMTALTDQLLSFARAEAHLERVMLEAVRVGDVVHRAMKAERGDHPEIRVDVDSELRVRGDIDLLFRCFSNLIRNAVKHGGPEAAIWVTSETHGNEVKIHVADEGPGVPEEHLDKLLDPFYRVEASRTRKTGGAGLGLSIVKTSVEACGGQVECRNRKPHGFEVIVTLERA